MVSEDEKYGRAALNQGEPWITPGSLVYLKSVMKNSAQWKVFEWGSGGSTVFWSKNCASVISVEHLDNWMKRTKDMLDSFNCPNNYKLHYEPVDNAVTQEHYRNYANAILKYDDRYDLIFIDGEATSRKWCLEHSLSRVKKGGYLLLDNSNWLEGHDFGAEWERKDYIERNLNWVGQAESFDWHTSILRKL